MPDSLQGPASKMADTRTGAVFADLTGKSTSEVERIAHTAGQRVPEGRIFFAIWAVKETWSSSAPTESTFLTALLGSSAERTDEVWDYYGSGAVRLYAKNGKRPTSTLMWTAVRRVGPKAYVRLRLGEITSEVKRQSTIPVSHKVFTRDVANNVWHLRTKNGMSRTIERLQFLTTWSDEMVLVYRSGRFTKRAHTSVSFDDDLIPVANKVLYELCGFPFAPSGKARKPGDRQIPLF